MSEQISDAEYEIPYNYSGLSLIAESYLDDLRIQDAISVEKEEDYLSAVQRQKDALIDNPLFDQLVSAAKINAQYGDMMHSQVENADEAARLSRFNEAFENSLEMNVLFVVPLAVLQENKEQAMALLNDGKSDNWDTLRDNLTDIGAGKPDSKFAQALASNRLDADFVNFSYVGSLDNIREYIDDNESYNPIGDDALRERAAYIITGLEI